MNDTDIQDDLRDYYGSIALEEPVRATRLVSATIRARRERGATRDASPRSVRLLGIAAALVVVLVTGVGLAAWRLGPNVWLPGGPAEPASPSASSSPIGQASESATASPPPNLMPSPTSSPTPRPIPTLHAATSSTPSGKFSPTGSMHSNYGTATLLLDGRVLMTGDYTEQTIAKYTVRAYTTSAELYDPATGKFSPTGSMVQPQGGATATRLADGRVLFAGGAQFSAVAGQLVITRLATAELYDPATGTFSMTGSMSHPRLDHVAELLEDGEVLIAGGDGNAPATDRTAELYDPRTGVFKPTGEMAIGRSMPSATQLADGRVLIVGGFENNLLTSAEVYDPKTGTFSPTGSLATLRMFYTLTLLQDGRVLVAGGKQDSSATSAEIYDPASGIFSPSGSFVTERAGASATLLLDGRVLFAGGTYTALMGFVPPGTVRSGVEADARLGGSTQAGLPVFADSRALPTTGPGIPGATLPSTILATAELYDPATGKFVKTGSMGTARATQTATLLLDGRVLIAGGDTTGLSAELYQP